MKHSALLCCLIGLIFVGGSDKTWADLAGNPTSPAAAGQLESGVVEPAPRDEGSTAAPPASAAPEVLTSIGDILRVGREGARLNQPAARLRGFVTLSTPVQGPRFYLQDATGALRVNIAEGVRRPNPGDEIETEGYLIGGLFAPFFVVQSWKLLGEGTPPAPRAVEDVVLAINSDDGAWAVLRGFVRNASVAWGDLKLEVGHAGRTWDVYVGSPGLLSTPGLLLESEIEVHGAALLTRTGLLAPSGVDLCVPSAVHFKLLKRGPIDRFGIPAVTMAQAASLPLRDGPRVLVRGIITHASPAHRLFIEDATGALEARLQPNIKGDPFGRYVDHPASEAACVGDLVEVLGAPAEEDGYRFFESAEYRVVGQGMANRPRPVDLAIAGSGAANARLVTIRGEVVGLPKSQLVQGVVVDTMLLQQRDAVFEAVWETRRPSSWRPAVQSWVAATGICVSSLRPDGTRAVRVYLQGPDSVEAVPPPALWQRPETMRTLAWVGLALTVTGAWIVLLRRVVRRRTRQLDSAVHQLSTEITEKRLIENQLRESLAKEREVGELKSNFVNLVSHEFRTPLGIIMSSAGILENYRDRLSEEKRHRCLHDIHRATRLMSNLVEDVLHLGKLGAGTAACQAEPVRLPALCARFAEEVRSSTHERCPIEVTTRAPDEPAWIDENLLRSIVINLLSNAVKYSPPGSPVQFFLDREGEDAVFTIADAGIGIAGEDQERLCEAFHRGGNVGDQPGSGLGLAIVKRCLDLHDGSIEIKSQLHHGTTVVVRLPCYRGLVAV